MKLANVPLNPTPRELLVSAAGSEHDTHSVVAIARSKQAISLTCSCREVFAIQNTPEFLRILRNVPME